MSDTVELITLLQDAGRGDLVKQLQRYADARRDSFVWGSDGFAGALSYLEFDAIVWAYVGPNEVTGRHPVTDLDNPEILKALYDSALTGKQLDARDRANQ